MKEVGARSRKRTRPFLSFPLRRARLDRVFRRLGFSRGRKASPALRSRTLHPCSTFVLPTPPSEAPESSTPIAPMDGPNYSVDNICNYSTSQEDNLSNTLLVREDAFSASPQGSPESSDPEPTPDDVGDIVICSVPTTQNSIPEEYSHFDDEYLTPPEEALVSSSEEQPQINRDIEEIVADDADSRDLGGKGCDHDMSTERNSSEERSKMVELGSGGKVIVRNICGVKIQVAEDNGNGHEIEGDGVEHLTEKRETVISKRNLPPSITQSTREDGEVSDDPAEFKKTFLEVLATLARKSSEEKATDTEDEDVDILETVKKRGVEFPRPGWW